MLLIFNVAAAALMAAAFIEGHAQAAFTPDKSILTWAIAGVFVLGLALCVRAARGGPTRPIGQVANALVMLGLIGTVWGFIVALSGVDPATAGDVSKVAQMVSKLVEGMGIALYTTLEGSVLALWLTVNRQMLQDG